MSKILCLEWVDLATGCKRCEQIQPGVQDFVREYMTDENFVPDIPGLALKEVDPAMTPGFVPFLNLLLWNPYP